MQKYTYIIFICIGVLLFTNCSSIWVNKTRQHTAVTQPVSLGVIGVHQNKVLHSDFQNTAFPKFKNKIRLSVAPVDFCKMTYKAYSKALKDQTNAITYVDSLENKPQFIDIELLDYVTVVSELKETYNQKSLQHLYGQKKAEIVTSVSLALPTEKIKSILEADAVFLINTKDKEYELSLTKKGGEFKRISFTEHTLFSYRLSKFCWGLNNRNKVVLRDIVDEQNSCPGDTNQEAQKLEQHTSYYKL